MGRETLRSCTGRVLGDTQGCYFGSSYGKQEDVRSGGEQEELQWFQAPQVIGFVRGRPMEP